MLENGLFFQKGYSACASVRRTLRSILLDVHVDVDGVVFNSNGTVLKKKCPFISWRTLCASFAVYPLIECWNESIAASTAWMKVWRICVCAEFLWQNKWMSCWRI